MAVNASIRFLPGIGLLLAAWSVPAFASTASECSRQSLSARAVRTPGDVEAFSKCAAEYVYANGTEEARRAFNEDERWQHGSIYVVVVEVAKSTELSLIHI